MRYRHPVEPPRPTQKDVARRAGVTQATVSLALRDHPSIPKATRQHIQEIVRELGYRPDPYLAGLSARRRQTRPPAYRATLAWLNTFPEPGGWRYWPVFEGYYDGARRRAAELGYHLEEHSLHADGMSRGRLEQILAARSITGLLLPPQPAAHARVELSWERYSAVTFGYSLAEPLLHLVALHHFRTMEIAFRRVIGLGCRRPGLALATESDRRADNTLSAAFWSEQRSLPRRDRIPLLQPPDLSSAGLIAWYRAHKPDVIIAIRPEVHRWLIDAGVSIPGDVGLALLSVPREDSIFSGIWENPLLTGAKAVELLISLIHGGEAGIPAAPVRLLIEGSWRDGRTVRPR